MKGKMCLAWIMLGAVTLGERDLTCVYKPFEVCDQANNRVAYCNKTHFFQ